MAALMDWVGVHGSWVEWSWLSPLLSSSLFLQSSLPSISVPAFFNSGGHVFPLQEHGET